MLAANKVSPVVHFDGSIPCERNEAKERTWMIEGDRAFPRKPIHGDKDLGPGIIGQQ
jgi:hypothetical protein